MHRLTLNPAMPASRPPTPSTRGKFGIATTGYRARADDRRVPKASARGRREAGIVCEAARSRRPPARRPCRPGRSAARHPRRARSYTRSRDLTLARPAHGERKVQWGVIPICGGLCDAYGAIARWCCVLIPRRSPDALSRRFPAGSAPWRALQVWLGRDGLDRELAEGGHPDTDPARRLRARRSRP